MTDKEAFDLIAAHAVAGAADEACDCRECEHCNGTGKAP